MKANPIFINQAKSFWANVRTISQKIGYTERGTKKIRIPSPNEIKNALENLGLTSLHISDKNGKTTDFGKKLHEYFEYRAEVLNTHVVSHLMTVKEAKKLFIELQSKLSPKCAIPMNKQKGDKKAPAYFTAIINMLIESNLKSNKCDFDPRTLTTITANNVPLRTLARRVDGAFPSAINPIAIWEIKEYYYTTTFGSRVADGIYETLLDGMEIEELREHENINVKHYLMIDDHYTWWSCGRSYLCRIIDMLHMGYIDEALFGCEVVDRLPEIVKEWMDIESSRRQ